MTYAISIENGYAAHADLDPLYRAHYAEMQERLATQGIPIGPYAPRLDEYFKGMDAGYILTFVVRCDGTAVGCANVYLTNDMHNGQSISSEDTIYITKEHRNGIGRKLTRFIMEELRRRGCLRAFATTATDPRVAKMLERMGWKQTAIVMTYLFEETDDKA